MIVCCSSNSVERADDTYSVMELVDLEIFLAAKNSDRLQEAQYNSEEGLRRFRWFLA